MITVIVRHLGPGPHPSGSPQSIHGGQKGGSQPVQQGEPLEIKEANTDTTLFRKECADFLADEFGNSYWDSLNDDLKRDLEWYRQDGFASMNNWLRGQDELAGYTLAEHKATEMVLDRAFGHQMSRDVVTFRGLPAHHVADMHVGDIVSDAAYVSTTLSRSKGEWFARNDSYGVPRKRGAGLCEIVVPKGAKVALTSPSRRSDGSYDRGSVEVELLLPRGSRFKVDSIENRGKMAVARLTLLKEGATHSGD